MSRPGPWAQLGTSARVTVVSSPAGSGKTVLLQSWIAGAGLAERAAWLTAGRPDHDPQRFWLSVLGALRTTSVGSALVREVTAAPDLDGWAMVERLLEDLAPLRDRLWLVLDDLHELGTGEVLRQLELLVMRAPEPLRFVLATRHDLRLGLHRLRLQGDLTEFRAGDLSFGLAEARELFAAAGVELPGSVLKTLYERTEGWVAGLRLAALSLVGHPDPARFAVEFSGSERTVAEYLLAEVLDRQGEQVRRLLLRTSVLEQVNGELADLLTGVVAGSGRCTTWRKPTRSRCRWTPTGPGSATTTCSPACSGCSFGVPNRSRSRRCTSWLPGGWRPTGIRWRRSGTPRRPETGSWPRSCWPVTGPPCTWTGDRPLAVVRLLLAWHQGDLPVLAQQVEKLDVLFESPETAQPALGAELHTMALVGLGDSEIWTGRLDLAEPHLEQAVTLARRIGRPYIEFLGLVYQAEIELSRWFPRAAERSRQAIEVAERHGWTDEITAGLAYTTRSAPRWPGRGNSGRQRPGYSAPNGPSARRRPRCQPWESSWPGVSSNWRAAGPPTR